GNQRWLDRLCHGAVPASGGFKSSRYSTCGFPFPFAGVVTLEGLLKCSRCEYRAFATFPAFLAFVVFGGAKVFGVACLAVAPRAAIQRKGHMRCLYAALADIGGGKGNLAVNC